MMLLGEGEGAVVRFTMFVLIHQDITFSGTKQLGLKHGGEGEGAVARFATLMLVHRHHAALRVAHVVGRHFLVIRDHVLVGCRLGDAIGLGVVKCIVFLHGCPMKSYSLS